ASAHINVDRFPLRVRIERLKAELAPKSALLHAAERRLKMHAAAGIDREVAALHGAGDAESAADVARPDRAGEAVVAVVGEAHGVGLVAERHHRDDGA